MSKQGVTEARQDWIVCAPVRRAALVKGPSWSMATGPLSLSCGGRAQTGPIYLARIFRHFWKKAKRHKRERSYGPHGIQLMGKFWNANAE